MSNIGPKVTVTNAAGEPLYFQALDDSKVINKLIASAMEHLRGNKFTIKIENNGHVMEFPVETVSIENIARTANGIKVTEKKEAAV